MLKDAYIYIYILYIYLLYIYMPDTKAPEIGAIVPTVVNDIERMSATATGYDVH